MVCYYLICIFLLTVQSGLFIALLRVKDELNHVSSMYALYMLCRSKSPCHMQCVVKIILPKTIAWLEIYREYWWNKTSAVFHWSMGTCQLALNKMVLSLNRNNHFWKCLGISVSPYTWRWSTGCLKSIENEIVLLAVLTYPCCWHQTWSQVVAHTIWCWEYYLCYN